MNNLRKLLNKFLIFPFLLGLYFPLSIISQNLKEIDLRTIPRSLLSVILIVLLLMIVLYSVLKSWKKSALVTAILVFSFFLYGLTYTLLKQTVLLSGILGRHRLLLPIFLMAMTALIWLVLRHKGGYEHVIALLNLLGLSLCLMTLVSFGSFLAE